LYSGLGELVPYTWHEVHCVFTEIEPLSQLGVCDAVDVGGELFAWFDVCVLGPP